VSRFFMEAIMNDCTPPRLVIVAPSSLELPLARRILRAILSSFAKETYTP